MKRRIGITGGRWFDDHRLVSTVLSRYVSIDSVLVHGACTGADELCARQWTDWGYEDEPHHAQWAKHGPAAGPIRNQEMVDSGLDLLVAFPGGRGTANMIASARRSGVPVLYAEDLAGRP